jgi:hypothetical protein
MRAKSGPAGVSGALDGARRKAVQVRYRSSEVTEELLWLLRDVFPILIERLLSS